MSTSPSRVPSPFSWFPWLCASGGALLVFFFLAWLIFTGDSLPAFDLSLAQAMKEHAENHTLIHAFFWNLTRFGGRFFLAALAAIGILAMAWRKEFLLAGIWLLAAGGGSLLNLGVKGFLDRQRPAVELRDPEIEVQHESFPSGHSMSSTIGYGMLLYVGLGRLRQKKARLLLPVGLVLLILLIGFSRVYLRAHWLSDVLAGFALGAAWLVFCLALGEWCRGLKKANER